MNVKQALEKMTMCNVYIDINGECKALNIATSKALENIDNESLLEPVKRVYPVLNEFNNLCIVIEA